MTIGINEGTQTNLKSTTDTGEEISHVRVDGGTTTVTTINTMGTLGSASSIGQVHNAGTVQILKFGTVDTFYRHPDEFATTVSTGTNVMGTIKPAVSGSAIYITDIIVSVGSATNVEIASGGTSTPIIGTLHFAANGGMANPNFKVYPRTASGSALVYKQSAAISPLTITCNGFVD